MTEKRCLYCYQLLGEQTGDFHGKCSKKFFGTTLPPELAFSNDEMQELAKGIVERSVTVTGVQPKLSLTIEDVPGDPKRSRFTIVGLWGNYILKPPTATFPNLPENEDLTMHLASLFGIDVADHSLIRLKSGELAYITKRFDRINGEKLPLEDMCQLTETLTADKYRGALEKIGKQVLKFATRPGLDSIRLFELTLFSYLTGNSDMHLKNFSLLTTRDNEVTLSPAYDLLSTKLAMPEDKEETALTINGRKRKLKRSDFDTLARSLTIPEKAVQNTYKRFAKKFPGVVDFIETSFLPTGMKSQYRDQLMNLANHLELLTKIQS